MFGEYTMVPADYMKSIRFAGIRKVLEKAERLAAAGIKVIHFEIGRPDFDTPGYIKAAAKRALDQGLVHYAPNAGLPRLREALAAQVGRYKGIDYSPETDLIVTAGGQEAMYLSLRALLDPGDEVLLPDPGFGPFYSQVLMSGGVPVRVPLIPRTNFHYDLEVAKKVVNARTKAIIVNSPHNPTGAVLSYDQIKELADFVREHDLVLLSDEAYDHMLYEGARHFSPAAFPDMRGRTVVCGSLSKTYAMTGWRIGYMAAPAELIRAAVKVQQNVMLSVCTFAQMGAVAALNGPQDDIAAMNEEFSRRRRLMIDTIAHIPGLELEAIPTGTFYVFVRCTAPEISSVRISDYLLDEAGVAVVDGAEFGTMGRGYLRLSYTTSYDDCREGLERIGRAMQRLMSG